MTEETAQDCKADDELITGLLDSIGHISRTMSLLLFSRLESHSQAVKDAFSDLGSDEDFGRLLVYMNYVKIDFLKSYDVKSE